MKIPNINVIYVSLVIAIVLILLPLILGLTTKTKGLSTRLNEVSANVTQQESQVSAVISQLAVVRNMIDAQDSRISTAMEVSEESQIIGVTKYIQYNMDTEKIIDEVTSRILAYKPVADCVQIKTENSLTLECIAR